MSCVKSGKELPLAKNMESDQNHNIKYQQFLQDLTRGHKPDQRRAMRKLKEVYETRLENKEVVKDTLGYSQRESTS